MMEGGQTPNQLRNKLAKAQKMRKLRVNKVWTQNIFIYFLAELDHSKTFFFSKKKNIFLGGSQNMTEGLRVPAST